MTSNWWCYDKSTVKWSWNKS